MSEVEADRTSLVDSLSGSQDEEAEGQEDSGSVPLDSDSDANEDEPVGQEEEEEEEENYTPLTLEQVQELFGQLDDLDDNIRGEIFLKLFKFIQNQEDFAAENADRFDIPKLVEMFEKTAHEDVPSTILCLLALLAPCSSVARQIIGPFVPRFLTIVKRNDYSSIAQLFEIIKELVTKEDLSASVAEDIEALFRAYINYSADDFAKNTEPLLGLLAAIDYVMSADEESVWSLFVKNGAFQIVLAAAAPSSPLDLQKAAAGTLKTFASTAEKWVEFDNVVASKQQAQAIIFDTFGQFLETPELASQAVDYFSEDRDDGNEEFKLLYNDRPNIVRSLVLQLCDKEPNHITAVDLLLQSFTQTEGTKKLLQDTFHNIFSDESASPDTISKLVQGLNCGFLDTRRVSLDAGFCIFFVQKLDTATGEDLEKYLRVFDESLGVEQMVGAYLALNQDHLQRFIRALEHESPSIRILSASILGRSLEGYLDEKSKRGLVMEELKRPEALAAILKLIRSEESTLAIAGLNLLSDTLAEEQGSESWNTSDDGTTPPTPLKDQLVSPELLTYVVGLFGLKDKPLATSALRLLSQICWGYSRGQQLTKLAFEAVTPTADAFFFSVLDEDWGGGRHGGRQRRHVQAAAAAGGGLARMESLLKHTPEAVQEAKALVEGYRALLCGDEVDRSTARTNPHLPALVARILKDGGVGELEVARWIIQLLHDDENPDALSSWTDVATKEVIDSLIAFVNIQPQSFEQPEQGEMPWEEFHKIDRAYDEKVAAEAARIKSIQYNVRIILENLVALFKPLADNVLGALLGWAVRSSDDDYYVLNLLKLYASTAGDGGAPETLRQSVKELIASDSAPSLSTYYTLIASGGALTLALYQEGLAQKVIGYFGSEKEEEIDLREAVRIIETFLEYLEVDEDKLVIKKAFFGHKPIVDYAVNAIVSADKDDLDFWFNTTTRALGLLVTGYPDGLAIVSTPELYDALLSTWDSQELSAPSMAPLLSLVSQQDPSKLAARVQQHIQILEAGKKKKNKSKLTKESVRERLDALAKTTPAVRQLLIDGGLLTSALKSLKASSETERKAGFDLLAAFTKDGDSTVFDAIVPALPALAQNFATSKEPMVPNLQLAALYIPSRISDLIEANYHRVLLKALSEMPTFGDFDVLLTMIEGIIVSDVGYGPAVEAIKELLEAEETYEDSWGHSLAFRRLLFQSPKCAKAVVDGGAVDYATKLLGHDSLQFATKAAALAADLARSTDVDCRARLVDLGAIGLIEVVLGRVKAATEAVRETLDSDAKDTYDTMKRYVSVVEQSLLLVKGEEVPGYEPDLFL